MTRTLAVLFFAAAGLALAQKPSTAPTVTQVLAGPLNNVERELVPLIEAMPEEKFQFAPTEGAFTGVRTFAQQATHTAAVLYLLSARLLGEKNPSEMGERENGPATLKSKADVVAYVKEAIAYAKKAAATVNEKNQLELMPSPFGSGQMPRASAVQILTWHSFDHYGQMVVYARMNGIVPPASR